MVALNIYISRRVHQLPGVFSQGRLKEPPAPAWQPLSEPTCVNFGSVSDTNKTNGVSFVLVVKQIKTNNISFY